MTDLKNLLRSIITGEPAGVPVKDFVALCRKIALIHLRRRAACGRLPLQRFGLSIEDASIDCIADLFNRDERGRFVQIVAYFESLRLDECSEELLFSHLRRLIFARVNNSIFRLYTETDPGFGKILRNSKLAIQALQNFEMFERFGETWIRPCLCDPLEHLVPADTDYLEKRLRCTAGPGDNIPTILSKLSIYLREEEEHARIMPLFSVAMIISSMYMKGNEAAANAVQPELTLNVSDIHKTIRTTAEAVCREMEPQYVGKKGLDPCLYHAYFDVIEEAIRQHFSGEDGQEGSFYDRLNRKIPGLTKDEYKSRDKAKLEYLAHLVQQRATEILKKEYVN